jgi:hypothetical protein
LGHVVFDHLDSTGSARLNHGVPLYALVASDCDFAVDVYPTRALAERALADVLVDEPSLAVLLDVAAIEDHEFVPCPN